MEQKNTLLINKSQLKGEITIPPSKSHTIRAILFASLAKGTSYIDRYLLSPDTEAMIHACRLFGAQIDITDSRLTIRGTGGKIQSTEDVIHAGNSGLVLRFCAAIGALSSRPVVITGDHSIRHQRPMTSLLQGLRQLGASAVSMRGDEQAPVIIRGPLKASSASISGEDSQPVSALLIASCFIQGETDLFVKNPGEKPWIALTLDWLDRLQVPYINHNFTHYHLFGNASFNGFHYTTPGDLSSAAFPIAAALITNSEITIHNIDLNDTQGDKEVLRLFEKMGAVFTIDNHSLHVKRGHSLTGITADINNCIDGITILAALACYAKGETRLYNAAIAKHKECNRITSIASELKKMGAQIAETDDGLIIKGSPLIGNYLHSYNDHRMAMSLSVAALGASGHTYISSIDCIAKTFPDFVSNFHHLGADIKKI